MTEPGPAQPDAPSAVIGVGASAGGVEALSRLVRALPGDLPAAVFVVLHVSPTGHSALATILNRAGQLPAVTAEDGARVQAGRVYVAPPDRHLLVEDGVVRLSHGPRENGHRPAVDPLLRSLSVYGPRAVGVIMTGTRDDGTAGLARIKLSGGTAFVQAPEEAAFDGMIRSALAHVAVDAILPVAELAARLVQSSDPQHPMSEPTHAPDRRPEPEISATRYTCPDCGGHIHREDDGTVLQYACEVGHRYAPDSLDGAQAVAVESALWKAARMLGDRSALLAEWSARARNRGHDRSAASFRAQSEEARVAGETIRGLIESGTVPSAADIGTVA